MAQIAAEELDVALARVACFGGHGAHAGTRPHLRQPLDRPRRQRMRYACAEARHLLLQEASSRLRHPADKLTVERGVISGFTASASSPYWDLRTPSCSTGKQRCIKPKPPALTPSVGTTPRADIPAKATGTPRFRPRSRAAGHAVRRVVGPFLRRATHVVDAEAWQMPGVVAVVRDGNFIGVVAVAREQAVKARQAAAGRGAMARKPRCPPTMQAFTTFCKAGDQGSIDRERSDPRGGPRATPQLRGTLHQAYIAHASPGAVVRAGARPAGVWKCGRQPGRVSAGGTIWRPCQPPARENSMHHAEGAGC